MSGQHDAPPRLSIGVDVGGTKINSALVDEHGQVVDSLWHPTDPERGPSVAIKEIVDSVKELLDQADRQVAGLGVGIAGQIDKASGTLLTSPNIQWRDLALAEELENSLDMSVCVTNDVRAAALGEWRFGAGRDIEYLICLFIGTGVGAGVVSGGRMLEGARSPATELGHVPLVLDGRECSCRNRGCLEAYVGGWAIAERAEQATRAAPRIGGKLNAILESNGELTAKDVGDAFHDGDSLAKQIIEETSNYLAASLVGMVNAFNPRRVILGGGVVEGIPELLEPLTSVIHQRAFEAYADGLEIERAVLGSDAGAIGAAELARRARSRTNDAAKYVP